MITCVFGLIYVLCHFKNLKETSVKKKLLLSFIFIVYTCFIDSHLFPCFFPLKDHEGYILCPLYVFYLCVVTICSVTINSIMVCFEGRKTGRKEERKCIYQFLSIFLHVALFRSYTPIKINFRKVPDLR